MMTKMPVKAEMEEPVELDRTKCVQLGLTCAAFNLRKAARLVSQSFDEALKPSGLKTTQFSLLVAAYFHQGKIVMNKLAREMGMDRTTLSRNLKLLEKKGLVELERGDDRREVMATLTAEGGRAVTRAVPLWFKAQKNITEGLGPARWEAMVGDLRAMGKLLSK